MRLAWVVALGLAIVLGLAVPASTQNFAPPPPPPPAPTLPSASTGPPATICSTDYGWCPIQYAATSRGGYCACFYPPNNNWILGRGRYWPYDPANTSPYLNPHTGPPATLR
jgi:hypothetical protein